MDAMVTARIPVEFKEQGNRILKEIGSSPTKLVNAAYEYLIENRSLPPSRTGGPVGSGQGGRRKLTAEQREALESFLARTDLSFAAKATDEDYKRIIAEGKARRYEELS